VRAVERRGRRPFGIGAVDIGGRERPHVTAIGLDEAVRRDRLHPGEEPRIAGAIGFTGRRHSGDLLVQPHDVSDHRLGDAARGVDGDQRRQTRALQPTPRIAPEVGMLPDARAHGGLGKLEDHRCDPAHEQRDGILENPPRDRIGRHQRGLADRAAELDAAQPSADAHWPARAGATPTAGRRPSS